ncbi:hypothetical protein CCACVL1_17959 [Corchorus capsularis]|uniref:Pre-mRNA splicing factor component Cdc5p/Cef1 C-terminal domain-containing protein n=1 Tax=Corchorus capsularis TaxID=210143 RepID=A0A1R3HP14_COCAP|nr:hypothetical protein CCACVL1_17959 [Corchorus capsularis]
MTPSKDGFGMTPKATPIRDELHINEDMDLHDSAKLEQRRQADLRRNLRSGLTGLPQPKNEYQIAVQAPPEDNEEPEEKIEEDMSDRLARERAEEEARQQALLKKRSKVLQRELPRPPAASLELIRDSLMRADGDKSTFVPPTSIEQAGEMIRKELLSLLEHDNAKYPLDEKANKGKKKGAKRPANGSIPNIEDFEEDEMKEADSLIEEEAEFLCVAMGHENESLDDFVEAHNTCLNDLMYFTARNAYGLSSLAGNMEKVAALETEFDNVKKKLDNDKSKAEGMEKKFNVLTQGYERRAATFWHRIDSTFKQMDTAGTELGCFQALQKQEQLAASHRINGLWEEVPKQKELEQTLQRCYGNLIAELEQTGMVSKDVKYADKQPIVPWGPRFTKSSVQDSRINLAISAVFTAWIAIKCDAEYKPLQFLAFAFAFVYRIFEKLKAFEPPVSPTVTEEGEFEDNGRGLRMGKRLLRSLALVFGCIAVSSLELIITTASAVSLYIMASYYR